MKNDLAPEHPPTAPPLYDGAKAIAAAEARTRLDGRAQPQPGEIVRDDDVDPLANTDPLVDHFVRELPHIDRATDRLVACGVTRWCSRCGLPEQECRAGGRCPTMPVRDARLPRLAAPPHPDGAGHNRKARRAALAKGRGR